MTTPARYVLLDAVAGQARALLRLHGADVVRFLQGTLTNDVSDPKEHRAIAAALLNPKAQLVADVIVIPTGEGALGLLVPAEVADDITTLLERHIIMDDVVLERDRHVAIALSWPAGAVRFRCSDELACWETRHPAPGDLVVGDASVIASRLSDLERGDEGAFTRWRIETASPAWGHELRPGRLPPEMGFVHAVSYSKGCYMGQEPLARVHARGQVNRVMVRIRSDAMPEAIGERLAAAGREKAGEWTSAAATEDGVVGLALVHRSIAEPGTELVTEHGRRVEVTTGPLGDDPSRAT